jgi:alkylation response protein AidB-like acyl-CoA dehydrogenase
MDRMLWTTVEYLKTRHQFGGPIGRFAALTFSTQLRLLGLLDLRLHRSLHHERADSRHSGFLNAVPHSEHISSPLSATIVGAEAPTPCGMG